MLIPLGTKMNAIRTGAAGADARAVTGAIASSNGNAIAVPIPFKAVRRLIISSS
jgi:hypothetical protein